MKLKRDVHNPEGVDLNLARSMKGPVLRLPRPEESVWLERPTDEGETAPPGACLSRGQGG